MEILDYISKYVEETNFFDDQKKLDTVYFLMQGLTYEQIAGKIHKRISYVHRVMNFLRNNGLLYWGRWTPNVYKIGMEKSIVFLNWKERKLPHEKNFRYATYVHHVQAENAKVLVVYTYPKEDEAEIKGKKGEPITPFYYTHTRFTIPFFKRINLTKKFFNIFDSMENDEKILIGTPSFETEKIYDDPITVYICRYCELLPELVPGILTDKLEQDFKDYKEVDISYEKVRTTLNRMKEEEVIFPRNALYFKPLSYQSTLVRIRTKKIYKIMKTFNEFNMLTRLALARDPDVFFLYLQYPFYQFSEVMEILNQLDPDSKTYTETKFVMGDTIYYQWSLDKFLDSVFRD